MPGKEAFGCQRSGIAPRGVQHHLHNAFHVPVPQLGAGDFEAQLSRNGRANLAKVKPFTLNFARLEHVGSDSFQIGLIPQLKPQSFEPAQQQACW